MDIDLNLVYAVLGVIATFIVGYFGIRYTLKYRAKTSLWYFENSCISLFKSVVKDLDELEIKYKGKTVDENLITYKGTFFNSGNIDIDDKLMYKPLSIILPKGYEWKKVMLVDKSENVNVDLTEKVNELQFSWDILKENEFFTFDSIIEYKPRDTSENKNQLVASNITDNLSRGINLSQRITNLKSIDKVELPSKPKSKSDFIFIVVLFSILVFVIASSLFSSFFYPGYVINYEIMKDSKTFYASIDDINKDEIELVDSNGKILFIGNSNISKQPKFTGNFKIVKKDLDFLSIFIYGILLILFLSLLVFLIKNQLSKQKIFNRVKEIINKHDDYDFT
ncbi:MAG: hypothetical protein WD048_00890 [Chitinophagales bacterium]